VCKGLQYPNRQCSIVIEGSGWHNQGLTDFERVQRYVAYMLTGVQPKRKLNPVYDTSTRLRATNEGR
jgi:hypothetical protein